METVDQVPGGGPPRRSSRRTCLVVLLVVFLVLIVACAGVGGAAFYLVFGALKSSEPYQMALEKVQQDPQVIDRLGEPIEDATWFPAGNLTTEDGRGSASLHFTVKGPKGEAVVGTQARRIGGQWGLTTVDVTFKDGQRILLEAGPEDGRDEAPKWKPPAAPQTDAGEEPGAQPATDIAPQTDIQVEIPELP